MPKTKTPVTKKKVVVKKPQKVKVETPQPAKTETPEEVKTETPQPDTVEVPQEVDVDNGTQEATQKVIVDNVEVVTILEEGETAKHCRMSDGSTRWVENERFTEK